ncbi:MAG: hypothetical protein ACI9MR_001110 [Myxococcota bacterium]|jgi:hypothetical protein
MVKKSRLTATVRAALRVGVVLATILVCVPASWALEPEPPPLAPGSASPYDAVLPWRAPFPTDGIAFHWPGALPCDEDCRDDNGAFCASTVTCVSHDWSVWTGGTDRFPVFTVNANALITAGGNSHRGRAIVFAPHTSQQQIVSGGPMAQLPASNVPPGFTVAFWFRSLPDQPMPGINPLVYFAPPAFDGLPSVPSLALVLDGGIPDVLTPNGELFGSRGALDQASQRIDDGVWHHLAVTVQLLCNDLDGDNVYLAEECAVRGAPNQFASAVRVYVDGSLRHERALRLTADQISSEVGFQPGIGNATIGPMRLSGDVSARTLAPSGYFDDVFGFQRALSNAEVARLKDRVEVGLRWLYHIDTTAAHFNIAKVERPDGFVGPLALNDAIVPSAAGDGLYDSSARVADADGPGSYDQFTLLGWVKPPTEGGARLEFRRGDAFTAREEFTLFELSRDRIKLRCGEAPRGAPVDPQGAGVTDSVSRVHLPSAYADGSPTWQLLGLEGLYPSAGLYRDGPLPDGVFGRQSLRVGGREGLGINALSTETLFCPGPPGLRSATSERLRFTDDIQTGERIQIAWVAYFDRILSASEQLAWAAPGPAFWVRHTINNGPKLHLMSDRTNATLYRGRNSCVFPAQFNNCSYAAYLEGNGPTDTLAELFSAATQDGPIAMGVAVAVDQTELGSRAEGVATPFTASIRFALVSDSPNVAQAFTLFRRESPRPSFTGPSTDVIVRLRCADGRCFRLDLKVPDHDGAGGYVERAFYANINIAYDMAHVITVSWAPGMKALKANDTPAGQQATVMAVPEPRIAIDGVHLSGDDNGPSRIRVLERANSGIGPAEGFWEGRVSTDYDRWLIGPSPLDGRDLSMRLLEARIYGREIESVELVGSSCETDPCGARTCVGLQSLGATDVVGGPWCIGCDAFSYPVAYDAEGHPSECADKVAFAKACEADLQCRSGVCSTLSGTCEGIADISEPRAELDAACAADGRVFDTTTRTCGGCLAAFRPTSESTRYEAHDPRLECAPATPTVLTGETCAVSATCVSGLCLPADGRYDVEYGFIFAANRQTHTVTDSTDCGLIKCNASKTYQWETLGTVNGIETPLKSAGCAAETDVECHALGQVAEVLAAPPDQAGVARTAYRCGAGHGQCLPTHTPGWSVLSPQACASLHHRAFSDMQGPTNATAVDAAFDVCTSGQCTSHWGNVPKWTYAPWKDDFLTADDNASAKRLVDVLWQGLMRSSKKPSYSANDYSELEARGVGPLLLEYLTNESRRPSLRQTHGTFLPLASCGSLNSYSALYSGSPTTNPTGATTFYPAVFNRAYWNGKNERKCVPKRQNDGDPCPPPSAPAGDAGHAYCKSRYCAADTRTCAQGDDHISQSGSDAGNDHNAGNYSVSFGVIRCDDTTLEVLPECDHTANTCGDGIDNDGDGHTDQGDADCWLVVDNDRTIRESLANPGQCTNNIDDDADGKRDAEDPDCDPATAFFAGEQPACAATQNDGDWRFVLDVTQSHNLCMFGTLFPKTPLWESNIHIDHSQGAACGSSSVRGKVLGITLNVPSKPLAECTGLEIELDPACRDAGGDANLQTSGGCEISPGDFLTDLGSSLASAAVSGPAAFLNGTANVCIPLPESFEDATTFKKSFKEFLVPISISIGLVLDACLEAFLGISGEDDGNGLPRAELKPTLAIGADARVGFGYAESGVPFEFWAGVRLELTFVALGFPIVWAPVLDVSCYDDGIADGPRTVNCAAPGALRGNKKLLIDVVLKMLIDFEVEFLAGAAGLFVEFSIGPFGIERTWTLFEWAGIKFVRNLLDRELARIKVDFEFQPEISTDLGGSNKTCNGECD